MVNEPSPLPTLPPHLTETHCLHCKAKYANFRAHPSWTEAANRIRARNGEGGGWRSRGPVLWEMRVMKMEAWLLAHHDCAPEDDVPSDLTEDPVDPFDYYDPLDGNPF